MNKNRGGHADEDDWRMLEIMGASAGGVSPRRRIACKTPSHRPGDENWRERELFAASMVSTVDEDLVIPINLAKVPSDVDILEGEELETTTAGSSIHSVNWRDPDPVCEAGRGRREQELPAASAASDDKGPSAPFQVPLPGGERARSNRVEGSSAIRRQFSPGCDEDGWRCKEVYASSCMEEAADTTPTEGRDTRRLRQPRLSNENWREREVMGVSDTFEQLRSNETQNRASGPEPVETHMATDPHPQVGDVVVLGDRAQEYRQCSAVVTKIADTHCTVTVLDESRRFGVGECWPGFEDLKLESSSWRVGSHVVINGLQSAKHVQLNGLSGRVVAHPTKGHPTFICKPSAPDQPQLTLCVTMDDPAAARQRSVLLEARYLRPYEELLNETTADLQNVMASLSLPDK